jgi:predicted GNAT family acetyltransferase
MGSEGPVREVRDNAAASRYELVEGDDVVGVADYVMDGNVMILPHTVIVWPRRGTGLGAELVRQVLDDARKRGLGVRPTCWYVAQFIDEHPEYQDLVAA